MNTSMFDGLPIRVTSVKEIGTNVYTRPSKERLKLAQFQGETLDDTLFHFREEHMLDVQYEGKVYDVSRLDDHFRRYGYVITSTTHGGMTTHYFELRKLAPQGE